MLPSTTHAAPSAGQKVNIVHISDTHSLEATISFEGIPLDPNPKYNILIHTGDATNGGTNEEFDVVDAWMGRQSDRFANRVIIPGNHDWVAAINVVSAKDGKRFAEKVFNPAFFAERFKGATHVLCHNTVEIEGIIIHGCSWDPWHDTGRPDGVSKNCPKANMWKRYLSVLEGRAQKKQLAGGGDEPVEVRQKTGGDVPPSGSVDETETEKKDAVPTLPTTPIPHHYHLIPKGVDIVLTHGPPAGILDCLHMSVQNSWGSSSEMLKAFHNLGNDAPKVHLFGHLHEQRGIYRKDPYSGRLLGRVEYQPAPGVFTPTKNPPLNYPPTFQIIANTAMANNYKIENVEHKKLVGGPRLIVATRASPTDTWSFSAPQATTNLVTPTTTTATPSPSNM